MVLDIVVVQIKNNTIQIHSVDTIAWTMLLYNGEQSDTCRIGLAIMILFYLIDL